MKCETCNTNMTTAGLELSYITGISQDLLGPIETKAQKVQYSSTKTIEIPMSKIEWEYYCPKCYEPED